MGKKRDTKLVDAVVRKLGLSQAQRKKMHDWMTREKLEDLTYREMVELAEDIKANYPRK